MIDASAIRQRPTVDRYIGCLVGQCVGNATSLGLAGAIGETCREYATQLIRNWQNNFADKRFPNTLQYGEGAQCAIDLLESFVEQRRFDPTAYAARIQQLSRTRRLISQNWETYRVAKSLASGVPWWEAGVDSPNAGPAERAPPIGMMYFATPDQLRLAATQQAQITHRNTTAIAGSVVIGEAIRFLLAATALQADSFLDELRQAVVEIDATFAERLHDLAEWQSLSPQQASAVIVATAPPDPYTYVPGGIPQHTIPSVLWALYAFLQAPGDLGRAIELSLFPGGEVVSAASLVGAFCGSLTGLESLPYEPCRRLTNGGIPMFERLVELARACHEIVFQAE